MIDDRKIFIIGAKGQLGLALQKQYPNAQWADIDELDITDKNSVESFDWSGIEYILNAAAYTNVDGAETTDGRAVAWMVNATAVSYLSSIATKYDCTLVHVSTDYVFDGTHEKHTEDEQFSPLSVYGASKAAGDIAVALAPKHYLLRTSWVIGDGKNFVKTMLSLAEKNISPTVVHDQIGRLTFTSELVRAIDFLLQKNAPYGVYNVSNDGDSASWADITREIFTLAGRDDLTVTDTTTKEYFKGKEGIAPRPLQSTLSLDKIQKLGFRSHAWQDDLADYIKSQDLMAKS
jgi:dTDP-4-dehydrorhamnose reductase